MKLQLIYLNFQNIRNASANKNRGTKPQKRTAPL
jgi:hypothetical protein